MSQPEQPESKNNKRRSITRKVGILLIVLMAVIACTLFLVIGICSGASMFSSSSIERKTIQLTEATMSLFTLRRGHDRQLDWVRIVPILTLAGVASFCVWIFV
jgi:hypothetical protein